MPKVGHMTAKPKHLMKSFKNFAKALKPWRVPIIFAMLLAIGATACNIFGPKVLGQMTDSAVKSYGTAMVAAGGQLPDAEQISSAIDWGYLGRLALILIVLYLTSAVLNYIEGVILSVVSAHYAKKVRSELVAKLSRLPVSYFDQHQNGDILSRITNDVDTVATTLTNVMTQITVSYTHLRAHET